MSETRVKTAAELVEDALTDAEAAAADDVCAGDIRAARLSRKALFARIERQEARVVELEAALRGVLDMFQVPISVMGGEAYNIDSATLRRARAALAESAGRGGETAA